MFDYAGGVKVVRHHVWVDHSVSRGHSASPGLLLAWRQATTGEFEGYVVMLDRAYKGDEFDRVTLLWLPAHCLSPVVRPR